MELGGQQTMGEAAQFLENLTKMTGMVHRHGAVVASDDVLPKSSSGHGNSLQAADPSTSSGFESNFKIPETSMPYHSTCPW